MYLESTEVPQVWLALQWPQADLRSAITLALPSPVSITVAVSSSIYFPT
jgi:hypothetical protein